MYTEVTRKLRLVVVALAAGLAGIAQEPISDKLEVTLPNTTWVGSHSLAPGKYRIRQLPTASSPRLLEFSSDNGTKMETAITTIAAIGNNTQHDTSVILEQKDGQYHMTHVWIAGKTYGYQLPVDVTRMQASTSKSESVTLAANFVPNAAVAAVQEPTRAQVVETPTPEPQVAVAPEPVASPEPVPAAAQVAQTPEAPQRDAADSAQASANQSGDAASTPPMPETATYWPTILLGGTLLTLLGWIIWPATPSA